MIVTNFIATVLLWFFNLFRRRGRGEFIGVTIWPFIFIHEDNMFNYQLIKHERCHIRQYVRYWIVGFPFVYLYQMLRYGYDNAPLEIEAREAEDERCC